MKWLLFTTRLLPLIAGAVHGVELLATAQTGREKQSAAVEIVRAMVDAGDIGAVRELLDDPEVEQALRASIDAYVALHNVIAKRHAPQAAQKTA